VSSLYTPEVRNYIFTRDWPKGLILEVAEGSEPLPHLNIVFFRDNWLTLSFEAQLKVTEILKELMAKLWNDGIPTYTGKMESAVDGR
jgi:hypothetical protein